MITSTSRWVLAAFLLTLAPAAAQAQVFVVGEKTATADIKTDFTPTKVPLPDEGLSERGRRELVRNLEAEQGFAHRALPLGAGLTLHANGNLSPGPEQYKEMIYKKGQAAAPGDRVMITSLQFKGDRIIFDLNGGPYAKHRYLSHIQFNDNDIVADPGEKPTGARITLVFEGGIPEMSAPEIKSLLEPLIDFGVRTTDEAYADTLPAPLKDAIAAHEILVGMNRRMVLAALGPPDSKVREQTNATGGHYEEWIYGHVPKTVKFVRIVDDRVTLIKIAAMDKPMEIHDKDEMAGYTIAPLTREIALGDDKPGDPEQAARHAPPTLLKPGEAASANTNGRVLFPDEKKPSSPASSTQTTPVSSPQSATTPPPSNGPTP